MERHERGRVSGIDPHLSMRIYENYLTLSSLLIFQKWDASLWEMLLMLSSPMSSYLYLSYVWEVCRKPILKCGETMRPILANWVVGRSNVCISQREHSVASGRTLALFCPCLCNQKCSRWQSLHQYLSISEKVRTRALPTITCVSISAHLTYNVNRSCFAFLGYEGQLSLQLT